MSFNLPDGCTNDDVSRAAPGYDEAPEAEELTEDELSLYATEPPATQEEL